MTRTYEQVIEQIESLKLQADQLRRDEVAGVVARIRDAISHYGLTPADLGFSAAVRQGSATRARKSAGAGVKFRNDSGGVWGGRGPRPRWLREALKAGKSLQDFAVK